jgi:hypothetical protein
MMKVPPTSPATQNAFDAIVLALAKRGVVVGAMFGMPSFKANGKAIGGLFGDELVFKLEGDAHAVALALKGARLFDPSGMGRVMKEWVVVPSAHAKKWPALAQQALDYVNAAPTNKKPANAAVEKSAATKSAAKKK